jgi:uncharacterized protein
MIPKTLKNFNLFVNGQGYAGRVSELTLPKLAIKYEHYRGGGMDTTMPIDMGMDTMSCGFTLAEYDKNILALFGLIDGSSVNLNFRGALDDGSNSPSSLIVNVSGKWQDMDLGSWQPGSLSQLKVNVTVTYYKLTLDQKDLIEIDSMNMVRKVNGVDQLAGLRQAIQV